MDIINKSNEVSLIYNDIENGVKVLNTIESQLSVCNEFLISVAFITKSGVMSLLETFRQLETRNIRGKILTSDYLSFTDPSAIKKLSEFNNLEIKIYKCENNQGFHTKGYIFKNNGFDVILIGSSNITSDALSVNKEWNSQVILTHKEKYLNEIYVEFNNMWEVSIPINDYIDEYTDKYNSRKIVYHVDYSNSIINKALIPNKMQKEFIINFSNSYNKGDKKGLLVSATGSGKTYASAFGIQEIGFKRVLFVAHRTKLLHQAITSYSRVFMSKLNYGLISKDNKSFDNDFIFANISTIGKEDIYTKFKPDHFDLIIYDEVHRAGSKTYQALTSYFNPKYLLGMSATPTRTDDFNIYEMFGYNTLHEITLQDALKFNLLCPFHYFGVTDLVVDNEVVKETSTFNYLTSDARIKHIVETIENYTYSDQKAKGLIFCSNIKEAEEISNKMNKLKFKTISLTSSNSTKMLIDESITLLESDDKNNYLDYIITVDLFNEGVDIPQVNQVIMLRPTKSPIIFTQQLGRGLRKFKGKYYVTIIDFIGNYQNNYMIPIALSNDYSYNKDTMRRFINEPNNILTGESTIHFDNISKQRIFKSLDVTKFNSVSLIKSIYNDTKNKLGKVPNLFEFDKYSNYDVNKIFQNNNFLSYYGLLIKLENNIMPLNDQQKYYLEFISNYIFGSKRLHESLLLDYLLKNDSINIVNISKLFEEHNLYFNNNTIITVLNILDSSFITGTNRYAKNPAILIDRVNDDIQLSNSLKKLLDENLLSYIYELVELAKIRCQKLFSNVYKNTNFVLYQKYTYDDVCKLLDWHESLNGSSIGGYFFHKKTNTFPVFINYNKNSNINESIKYEDKFISNKILKAMSKSNRGLDSKDVKLIYNKVDPPIKHLFIRKNKNDSESKEFYYLGIINPINNPVEKLRDGKKETEITYELDKPVRADLYDYITNTSIE